MVLKWMSVLYNFGAKRERIFKKLIIGCPL